MKPEASGVKKHIAHILSTAWMSGVGAISVFCLIAAAVAMFITGETSPESLPGALLQAAALALVIAFPGWIISMVTMDWEKS